MNTERAAFIDAILNQPADDNARLVYADWLREQPDATSQALGRFLWAGVTLARYKTSADPQEGEWWKAVEERDTTAPTVLAGQVEHLFGWPWKNCGWDVDFNHPDHVMVAVVPGVAFGPDQHRRRRARVNPAVIYHRGMPHTLRLTLPVWLEVARRVMGLCPIERIELVDIPGIVLTVVGPDCGWSLAAHLDLPASMGRYSPGHGEESWYDRPAVKLTAMFPGDYYHAWHGYVQLTRAGLFNADATTLLLSDLRSRAGDRWPGPDNVPAQDDLLGETDPDVMHREVFDLTNPNP